MNKVRLGIVGVGAMGSSHLNMDQEGKIRQMTLTAVCDVKQDRLDWAKEQLPELAVFDSA